MSYQNPLPPEGINVTRENHLAALFWLVIGFVAFIAASVAILYLAGGFLISHMPFRWEVALVEQFERLTPATPRSPREKLLQQLADRLAAKAELPPEITFRIHYVDDGDVNAYAQLGGNIIMHRGLMERLDSENALAFVLAHEMSHVIHRDPAEVAGGQLLVASVLGAVAASGGFDLLQGLTGSTRTLTLRSFSRENERAADLAAMQIVGKFYGHLGGVEKVFSELVAFEHALGVDWVPEMLNTHPDGQKRLSSLPLEAEKTGLSLTGKLTPLPLGLQKRQE